MNCIAFMPFFSFYRFCHGLLIGMDRHLKKCFFPWKIAYIVFFPLGISFARHVFNICIVSFCCSNLPDFWTFSLVSSAILWVKFSDKNLENMLCDYNTQGKNSAPFIHKICCQWCSCLLQTVRCTVFIKLYCQRRNVFRKNGVVFFPLGVSQQNIFLKFLSENLGSQNHTSD